MLDEKYSSYAEKVLAESDKSDTRRIYKDIFRDSNVVITKIVLWILMICCLRAESMVINL